MLSEEQAMVTLSTVFFVAFPQRQRKESLVVAFSSSRCCLLVANRWCGGNKYLFLTVFIHRILAFLKDAIHIHRWPPGLLKAAEGSF